MYSAAYQPATKSGTQSVLIQVVLRYFYFCLGRLVACDRTQSHPLLGRISPLQENLRSRFLCDRIMKLILSLREERLCILGVRIVIRGTELEDIAHLEVHMLFFVPQCPQLG